jgi:glycerophosphoryl diester phosphodiesterase
VPWSSSRPPLVIAHRGASARATENTAEAFAAAREDGADGVELDVRPCATGEPIVFHDPTLRRLAGRGDAIASLSLSELRTIRLRTGERVLTLDEAFEAVGELLVNVEIKVDGNRFSRAFVTDVVRRTSQAIGNRGLISSFHPGVVWAAGHTVPTGLLFHAHQSPPLSRAWAAAVLRPTALHPQHILVTPAGVRRWHMRGYRVHTWTADTYTEIDRLVRCHVDAIITNDPNHTRRVIEQCRVR